MGHGPFTRAELLRHDNFSGVLAADIAIDGSNCSVYILMLHYWSEHVSSSVAGMRALSVLFGVALVLVVFFAAWRITADKMMALCAALLCAISPMFLVHSQDCRTYALATFLTTLSTWFFFRLLKTEQPRRTDFVIYVVAVSLSLLAHYSTCYIFMAHVVIALMERIDRRKWMMLSGAALLVGLVLLLWLFNGGFEGLGHIAVRNEAYRDQVTKNPEINTFFNASTPRTMLQGAITQLLWITGNGLGPIGGRVRFSLLLIAIPAALIVAGFITIKDKRSRTLMSTLLVLALSGTVYATALAAISGHTVAYEGLYGNFSAPWMLALMAISTVTLLRSTEGAKRFVAIVLIAAQLMITFTSLTIVYKGTHGTSTNQPAQFATRINDIACEHPDRFHIVYGEPMTAMLTNLYLCDALKDIRQEVDSTSDPAITLRSTENGIAPIVILQEPLGRTISWSEELERRERKKNSTPVH